MNIPLNQFYSSNLLSLEKTVSFKSKMSHVKRSQKNVIYFLFEWPIKLYEYFCFNQFAKFNISELIRLVNVKFLLDFCPKNFDFAAETGETCFW